MPQEVQRINMIRAPQPVLQWVAISNRMDYSLWRHALVTSGKSHNPSLNTYHLQPKPTGKSQGCHTPTINPKKPLNSALSLQFWSSMNLQICPRAQVVTLGATWMTAPLWHFIRRGACFCTPAAKTLMGFATAHCNQHHLQGWKLGCLKVK